MISTMNWSRMYLFRHVEDYVSKNENSESLLNGVKRYIWKNNIDEAINKYKSIGFKHCFVMIPYKLINGNYNTLYEECYVDIKNHYENLGYSTRIKECKFKGMVDGHLGNVYNCNEIEISWFNKNIEPNLNDIKEDLNKELKNRFIVFEDSEVDNLDEEELLVFYKSPSLRWGNLWRKKK